MSRELSPVFVFFFVIALPLSCCFYRFLTRDDYDAFCHIQNAHAFLSTLSKMQRIKYFLLDHCSVYVPGSTCSERVIIEGYIHKVFKNFIQCFTAYLQTQTVCIRFRIYVFIRICVC